ncbi:expressed unknown protein [Seminavis robusta]|uniref:Uncharacterized protein n=1 Tax=Seminavis robusta TaxID=568900 RepID=A0A9N8DGM8_9STRA|nr:expressed unknown protein [Seminavis robusta]|eukprot:Sro78_g042300.1 n/a (832) ;mRNA; r:16436-19027
MSALSDMPTPSEMPTDEIQRPFPSGAGRKNVRPFTAVDNPTDSPSYSLSPSPVQDWTVQNVSLEPTDQPQYAARSRGPCRSGIRSVGAPTAAPTVAAVPTEHARAPPAASTDSSDLRHLDSLLMENGGMEKEFSNQGRDWMPDDFAHPTSHPHPNPDAHSEMSPKKRRVERPVHDDVNDLHFAMPVGLPPMELDFEHTHVDDNVAFEQDFVYEHEMHNMHPDLAFSYAEEEEMHVPMPPLPRAHHRMYPRPHPHALPHPHPHPTMMPQRSPMPRRHVMMHVPHPHAQEYIHEMDVYPPLDHEAVPVTAPSSRSPIASPSSSPAQMQGRRIVGPAMLRNPVRRQGYRPRYMNGYVSGVPVPMGGGRAYYRRGYARHQPYPRFVNPANLPSPRVRKAYHLGPMVPPLERRGSVGAPGPYFLSTPEEDPFWAQHGFFAPEEPTSPQADHVAEDRSPTSVAALDRPLQDTPAAGRPSEMKRMSLPTTLKLSSPQAPPKATQDDDQDKKPSALKAPPPPVEERKEEEEGLEVLHFRTRDPMSLAIPEDSNWLSEFQSYVRLEFLEIFRASQEDVKFRNTSRKVAYKQLGIRCRFCAHVHPGSRARRSSAYPSSTAQIYQSFNMMIRDHFSRCEAVPKEKMDIFHKLKGRNNQGAADSKHFWSYAAEKMGMVDSKDGIHMNDATQLASVAKPPFSATNATLAASRSPPILLVFPEDKSFISPFLFELLSRVQRVHLLDIECRSTRKNLKVGLPGFGCRYCCEAGRLGFSRIFPTKRKGLPEKANDMYEHFRRCTLCPPEVKDRLQSLRPKQNAVCTSTEKVFFDRVWTRLNDGDQPL